MKVIIENYITDEDNLLELNHFLMICTQAQTEAEIRNSLYHLEQDNAFDTLEEKGMKYGFGHHHFWLSENQFNKWERILFIDFSDQPK